MKYLKVFESFNSGGKFYWPISASEFMRNTEMFEFTEPEIQSIKSICDKKYTEVDFELYDPYIHHAPTGSINLETNTGGQNLFSVRTRIDKEEDEYFAVAYNIDRTPEYYKADQIEGLLKLLEDIL